MHACPPCLFSKPRLRRPATCQARRAILPRKASRSKPRAQSPAKCVDPLPASRGGACGAVQTGRAQTLATLWNAVQAIPNIFRARNGHCACSGHYPQKLSRISVPRVERMPVVTDYLSGETTLPDTPNISSLPWEPPQDVGQRKAEQDTEAPHK